MEPYVAVTNPNWFRFLRDLAGAEGRLDEVNFWNPSGKALKGFRPGDPIFFRLKAPHHIIAGYGFFAFFQRMRMSLAWNCFGAKNGAPRLAALAARIRRDPMDEIGCTMLRDVRLWPDSRCFPWGSAENWKGNGPNRGKTVRDPRLVSRLLAEIQFDHAEVPEDLRAPFHLVEADERAIERARTIRREGQGVFRSKLLDAYQGRCAITGEHTAIVLDAAHIQPYLGPRSNHPQNGLLLTKEFHALFDAGYVTITPELHVRVSPRLRAEWHNGRRYYPVDGRPLQVRPRSLDQLPSPEALAWHNETVFRA